MLRYCIRQSTFGYVMVVMNEYGVVSVDLGDDIEELKLLYNNMILDPTIQNIVRDIIDGLTDRSKLVGIPMNVIGTEFQLKVWKEIVNIPIGTTITYRELAVKIGKISALRAVANACGANKLAIMIPCHRVVSTNGLGGYRYGVERKKIMLDIERQSLN